MGGCGPRLRERTQGPATAREPPDSPPAWRAQALLPETARIPAHCLCTTRSSREVEPEEEGRGGEGWGEGRPASSPSANPWKLPLGFYNPLGGLGRTSKGEVATPGQTPTGPRTCSHPPTHHCVPYPPEMRGRAGRQEALGRGEGATNPRGTLSTDRPSFLRSPTISSFPRPAC